MSDPICPGRTAAGKLLGREEAAAGVFSPGYAHPVPTDMRRRPCFRCWALPDACLEVLPTRLTSKGAYDDPRSNVIGVKLYPINSRPFRLHVAGLTHAELRTRLDRLKAFVMDPLRSELLRHLESDVFWIDRASASLRWPLYPAGGSGNASGNAGAAGGDDELVMIWPRWEKGYGDVIANTLLPFGEMLRRGTPPRHLALSGMRHATLLPPLRAATVSLCGIERDHEPLLPRCVSTCWRAVRICAPNFAESTADTWLDTIALDAAAAAVDVAAPTAASAAIAVAAAVAAAAATDAAPTAAAHIAAAAASLPPPPATRRSTRRELRVLIAARSGRRLLANDAALSAACDGVELEGTRLRCSLLPASLPQAAKIARLREADAYVCVWGGDTVHALHMRQGSAVIELRNEGFAKGAPHTWLDLHKRWVTRYAGPSFSRPLHFTSITLPANWTLLRAAEHECFVHNAKKRKKLIASNAKEIPQDDWLCYWNADFNVPFEQLRPALQKHIQRLKKLEPHLWGSGVNTTKSFRRTSKRKRNKNLL